MPLQREVIRVYLPWVYLTQYVPLSGFRNLLAVSSSNHPEAFFHASSTHGVFPLRAFPLKVAPHSRRDWFPRVRHTVLRPQPPACLQTNSWTENTRKCLRSSKYTSSVVLIHSQVRSHPVLVLPSTSGRYSWVYLGRIRSIPSTDSDSKSLPHMYKITSANKSDLHYRVFKVNQWKLPLERTCENFSNKLIRCR
jgi:hypothetical protein